MNPGATLSLQELLNFKEKTETAIALKLETKHKLELDLLKSAHSAAIHILQTENERLRQVSSSASPASVFSQDLSGISPEPSVASSGPRGAPRSLSATFCSDQTVHSNIVTITKESRATINKVVHGILENTLAYQTKLGFPGNSKDVTSSMLSTLARSFPKIPILSLRSIMAKVCGSKRGYANLLVVAEDVGASGPVSKRLKGLSLKKEPHVVVSVSNVDSAAVETEVPLPSAEPILKPTSLPKGRGPPGSSAPYSFLGSEWVHLV